MRGNVTPSDYISPIFTNWDNNIWKKETIENTSFRIKKFTVDNISEPHLFRLNKFLNLCNLPRGIEKLEENNQGKLNKKFIIRVKEEEWETKILPTTHYLKTLENLIVLAKKAEANQITYSKLVRDLFKIEEDEIPWIEEKNSNLSKYSKTIKINCNPENYIKSMNCFLNSLDLPKGSLITKKEIENHNDENLKDKENYFLVTVPKNIYEDKILPRIEAINELSRLNELAESIFNTENE